jgi:hypothetical protein
MPTTMQPPNEPPFELLIDGHHLDVFVLLHVVPGGGIRFGPDDCGNGLGVRKMRRKNWAGLTTGAAREAGEVPCAADDGGAHDDETAG